MPEIERRIDIQVASRSYRQKIIRQEFKLLFVCCKCKKEVEPDKIEIGRAHVYFKHCGMMQDVGIVA